MEQALSNVCSFMRWWARSDKQFAVLFVSVGIFLWSFSSLSFIFFLFSIFLEKNTFSHCLLGACVKLPLAFMKLTLSCRGLIKFGFTPLMPIAPHRSAPAPRSLHLSSNDLFNFFFSAALPLTDLPTVRVMPRTASPGFHISLGAHPPLIPRGSPFAGDRVTHIHTTTGLIPAPPEKTKPKNHAKPSSHLCLFPRTLLLSKSFQKKTNTSDTVLGESSLVRCPTLIKEQKCKL